MAYRDTEVVLVPRVPGAAMLPAPDWPRLYERAVERAEAAEARAERRRSTSVKGMSEG